MSSQRAFARSLMSLRSSRSRSFSADKVSSFSTSSLRSCSTCPLEFDLIHGSGAERNRLPRQPGKRRTLRNISSGEQQAATAYIAKQDEGKIEKINNEEAGGRCRGCCLRGGRWGAYQGLLGPAVFLEDDDPLAVLPNLLLWPRKRQKHAGTSGQGPSERPPCSQGR